LPKKSQRNKTNSNMKVILISATLISAAFFLNVTHSLPAAYTDSNANWNNSLFQGEASATAGVGKKEGSYGVFKGSAVGPEIGVQGKLVHAKIFVTSFKIKFECLIIKNVFPASGGLDKVGYGFRATAGEVEGRIGGALGVGGKLGLSADSYAHLGSDGIGAYVIGTGMSITKQKGFEFCLFGSCISIG